MNNTSFSVIGSGYFIKLFDTNHPFYRSVVEMDESQIFAYIIGFGDFRTLNILDEKGIPYSSFYELFPSKVLPVYAIDNFSRMEVKYHNKFPRTKIMFRNLKKKNSLPLHTAIQTTTPLKNPGLIVIESDRGHFGRTEHPVEYSETDPFTFEIMHIKELKTNCISSIKIRENQVILKCPETLNYNIQVFKK